MSHPERTYVLVLVIHEHGGPGAHKTSVRVEPFAKRWDREVCREGIEKGFAHMGGTSVTCFNYPEDRQDMPYFVRQQVERWLSNSG